MKIDIKSALLSAAVAGLVMTGAAPLAAQGMTKHLSDVGAPSHLTNAVGNLRFPEGFYRRDGESAIYRIGTSDVCQVTSPQQMWDFGGFGRVAVLHHATPYPFTSAPLCNDP